MNSPPILRKAKSVQGKTLKFRNATVDDASFIFSLRTDFDKSRYLSPVSGFLSAQEQWLFNYEKMNDQAYFIIEYMDAPLGTVRLYDPRHNSFCWGSWILRDNRPSHAAIESALMVYAYAMDHLGFDSAHFDVRKGNESVWRFHERFGAKRSSETDLDFFYEIDRDSINASRARYRKYLDFSVVVSFF